MHFQDFKGLSVAQEFSAGFLVFLITLPLCMGIALASGFPPIAGLFTSIVGGLFTGLFGGSRLSIKGAPAGLIVIVLAAVQELTARSDLQTAYHQTLAICFIAGLVQIIFGMFKLGKFSEYIPESVIHGMIAAIGVIVIAKQIHVVLGVTPLANKPLGLLAEIPLSVSQLNPGVFLIGALSLLLMFITTVPRLANLIKIPAALLVMILALAFSFLFNISQEHHYIFMGHTYDLSSKFLVSLPKSILAGIAFPDFSVLTEIMAWKHVFLFALVGSIESLLTVRAVDKMDPEKQISDANKDLVSVGVANSLVALIGGLPMISEVSRSKANIDGGAKTSLANFFHGLLLLLAVILFPELIALIPTAALAGILVFIGYRLAAPSKLKEVKESGLVNLACFLLTCILTVAVDLLVGVAAGILLYLVVLVIRCRAFRRLFKLDLEVFEHGESCSYALRNYAVLTTFPLIREHLLDACAKYESVSLDLSHCQVIDSDFKNKLMALVSELGSEKVKIIGTY